VVGLAALFACGALFAARPASAGAADPTLQAARDAHTRVVAAKADAALAALQAALAAALEAGRRGTARVVDGSDPPEGPLGAAARRASAAEAPADAVEGAMAELAGTLAAGSPDAVGATFEGLSLPTATDLRSIAGQLREAADAAGPFVERRLATEATLLALEDALRALDTDNLRAALRALQAAEAERRTVAEWDPAPATLPFWLRTVRRLTDAAQRIARATIAGDREAVAQAAADYRRAAARAHRADVALGIAIGETGSGIAGTPLARLAAAARATAEARAAVASVLHR
jgi:hypothetical protein